MKRILIALAAVAASATFAAPASADTTWAPCGSQPLVECVTSKLDANVAVAVCNSGESADECAERLALYVITLINPQNLVTTVFDQVEYAGTLANWAIETAEHYCGEVVSTCDDGDMPLLP
jgi:molybdopterin-guanine dinucleotide biosynthesis protein A